MATVDYVINPDRFQTFVAELESRKTLLTTITDLHKTLTASFTSLDQTLTLKSQTLDTQIESFNTHKSKSLLSLQSREDAIPERESAMASRVEELKKSAINDIETYSELAETNLSESLRGFFRRMDSGGLMRFLLAKRKESVALRTEINEAVGEAVDLMAFVVDAVEEFVRMKAEGKVGLADRRWASGILIQAALPIRGSLEDEEGKKAVELGGGVAGRVKEKAAEVLEKWKDVLGGGEGSDGVGAGEATMFLQMVIGFELKDKFEEGFLRKLVVEFASRRDMAKLAVAFGFGDKMGDIIDELVKSGKEVEAVYFATESGLTERFPPVNLLKTCLKKCRKNANTISKGGPHSSLAVEAANNSELNAVKAIIKCVEDHKLESQFTIDSLKKRVIVLEKAKADKKRSTASTSKSSNKRAHGGSGRGSAAAPSLRPPKSARFSNSSPAFRQRNLPPPTHRPRYAAAPYSYPSQSVYESPTTTSYSGAYGATHTQSPVGLPQQYGYTAQDVGPAGVTGASYAGQVSYGGQSNYAAYDYSAPGGAAPTPSYPATYKL